MGIGYYLNPAYGSFTDWRIMNRSFFKFVCAILLALSYSARAAESDVGIVLLHGKWDRPPTNITVLGRALQSKGFQVAMPTMPWSGDREYDADYPAALAEIEAAAKSLRDKGAKRIIVGGLSFGANASVAYAGQAGGRRDGDRPRAYA